MTDITKVGDTINAKEVMSSLEIAELTGKRHADVMRDIRNIIEQLDNEAERSFALSDYQDSTGRTLPMYVLSKKGSLCLASGYDAKLRMAIINRWEELELKNKNGGFKVPTSFKEALLLAAKQQEEIEKQQLLIEEQKPKVEFYDDVVDSKDAIDMAKVAKTLNMGIGRNNLFQFLRDKKVLMQNNTPYQYYVDNQWFRCVESRYMKPNGDICINIKTVVLQKGLDGIRKLLKEK